MIWTDTQVEQLHALWRKRDAAGEPMFSREQIAEALGIGLAAVIAKLGREYQNGRLERRVTNATIGGRQAGIRELTIAKIATEKSLTIRAAKPLPPASLPRASMMATGRPHDCQWPMWRHGDRAPMPPLFCGAVVLYGHAYCRDHCRRAFHNWHELSRVAAIG